MYAALEWVVDTRNWGCWGSIALLAESVLLLIELTVVAYGAACSKVQHDLVIYYSIILPNIEWQGRVLLGC